MDNFTFKNGYRVAGITAQIAGEELARIEQQHGELKPPTVVDEARPENSLLHPAFEWDDFVAAELHRQDQARHLIRAVQVIKENNEPQSVYVHINKTGSYLPVETVVSRNDLYEDAYRAACSRIGEAQKALSELERLAATSQKSHIIDAMESLTNVKEQLALANQ